MADLGKILSSIISVDELNRDGCPTASIAVLEDGKISSHVVTTGPENPDTVYQVCSISKAIAAIGIARLVDLKRLSYEDKAIDLLPSSILDEFLEPKTKHLAEHVTIAMLLSHTAGLSQHGFDGYVGEKASMQDIIAGRSPSNTPKLVFNTFPGLQSSYSGGGYLLLQCIAEKIMDSSFPELMHELVFKPLQMTRSSYRDLPAAEANFAKAHVTAYVKPRADYHNFTEMAAGGLWSTPTDLLKAISAVQTSLHSDNGFLSRETARSMLTKQASVGDYGSASLGWGVSDAAFGHSGGNDPGYMSYFFGFGGSSTDADKTLNGVAITINSTYGHWHALERIMGAVFFAKGWDRVVLAHTCLTDDYGPYVDPSDTKLDDYWKEWVGQWGSDWTLVDEDGPVLRFKSAQAMALDRAAAPTQLIDGRREIVFAVTGLRMGVLLTWEDGERVFKLLKTNPKVLKKE